MLIEGRRSRLKSAISSSSQQDPHDNIAPGPRTLSEISSKLKICFAELSVLSGDPKGAAVGGELRLSGSIECWNDLLDILKPEEKGTTMRHEAIQKAVCSTCDAMRLVLQATLS